MTKEIELTKHWLTLILLNGGDYTAEGFYTLIEIKDDKELLTNLKAINSIINTAIKQLKKGNK